ncbi:MAG: FAD-dependent oxidoreductase, partial [Clostridia bacterium]|nr:FAD-dependent oxidoreductase [Clostridia bacterium]
MYDIIVIGGGPAGLTAALYALRADKKVLIIEKNAFGGQMTNSPKIENFPGYSEISGIDLADKMLESVLEKGAEVELDEVLSVTSDGAVKKVKTTYSEYESKAVIIANGVKHRTLGLEHEDELTGRGVYYCAVCDGGYMRGLDVILIGGGNSALQEAVLLSDICKSVKIVQNLSDFTGEAKLASAVRSKPNVSAVFDSVCEKLILNDGKFAGVEIKNTKTGEHTELFADGMFVAIGLLPDNKRFAGVAPLDKYGYFDTDENCIASQGVFVAGDCRSKRTRQIVTAAGDGASAALA